MKSLLNKKCIFTASSLYTVEEDITLNLTFTTTRSTKIYNQLKILPDEGIFFDDAKVFHRYHTLDDGYTYEYNQWEDSSFREIIVTGGEDVNNQELINKFITQVFVDIMHAPNTSKESLDNKVIKFNSVLTSFPLSFLEDGSNLTLYGTFKARIGNEEDYYYITANYIQFIRLPWESDHGIKFGFNGLNGNPDNRYVQLSYNHMNRTWLDSDGNSLSQAPIFEEFKYTGLEEDKDFMDWLMQNAKISPKKNKDKKITNLQNCTITFNGFNYWCPTPFLENCYARGYINNRLEILGIGFYCNSFEIMGSYYMSQEDSDYYQPPLDGAPTAPGNYQFRLSYYLGGAPVVFFDDGSQIILENFIITGFYSPLLTNNPDFIDWVSDNLTVYPYSIENYTIEFNSYLGDINYYPFGSVANNKYEGACHISFNLNGEQIQAYPTIFSFVRNENGNITKISFPCGGFESNIENTAGYQNVLYSFQDNKWCFRKYYITYNDDTDTYEEQEVSIEYLSEGIKINYFYYPDLIENSDFIEWVVDNSNTIATKGVNTTEELLENICTALRIKLNDKSKINAQDIAKKIADIRIGVYSL